MIGRPCPLVSFVIPVRDDATRLRNCLDSIAQNDYPLEAVEVIVVDNGSRDDSPRVAQDRGARVLTMPKGRVAELRNAGAAEARGDILAFVDADHVIDRHWIAAAATALAGGAVGAGAPCVPPPDGNWVQQRYDGLRSHPAVCQDVEWLGSGNLAVRHQAFQDVGGFDTSLETCEDVDLCQRLRGAGHRLTSVPGMRSIHFGDPSSLKALFFGELWRGRDNLRVTLRGPWTWPHLRSAAIPAADLAAFGVAGAALAAGRAGVAGAALMAVLALAGLRAFTMVRRDPAPGRLHAVQALGVALTYDVARALALLTSGSHRARRSAETVPHVTADSHS